MSDDPIQDMQDDLLSSLQDDVREACAQKAEIERLRAAIKQAVWEAEEFGKVSLSWVYDARRLVEGVAPVLNPDDRLWVEIHGLPEAADNLDYKARGET